MTLGYKGHFILGLQVIGLVYTIRTTMYVACIVSDAVITISEQLALRVLTGPIAMKRYTFSIDDATAEWWQYHFDDALLRNDVSWRTWRIALQKQLSQEQLSGDACGICGNLFLGQSPHGEEYLGGYRISFCLDSCESPIRKDIQKTLDIIEGLG